MKLLHVLPPLFPARHLILSIEPKTKNTVHLVFSGNTKPCQDSFVKGGCKSASVQRKMRFINNTFVSKRM
eukprot:12249533-Karenia_brevis.AAC.1